jgi:signal transduction histidine kinase
MTCAEALRPDIVTLSTQVDASAERLNQHWHAIWDKLFQPQSISPSTGFDAVHITAQGECLQVPAIGVLSPLLLRLPQRGTRLFNPADARQCQEIVTLIGHGLNAQDAHARGVLAERQRIAADLHDDLGAKLLSIAQAGHAPANAERISTLARQALDEMRLSLRGLTAKPAAAHEVFADWRAETMLRLEAAQIQATWHSQDPPADLMLEARLQVQITRVLRETISNLIRHSGATECEVQLHAQHGQLTLSIADNGCGFVAGPSTQGHGLINIERRARHLGGNHVFGRSHLGGALVSVQVPLPVTAAAT